MGTKDIIEVIARLKNYQDWRRGNINEMPKPKDVGGTIDKAILILQQSKSLKERVKELEAEVESLKQGICLECRDSFIKIDSSNYHCVKCNSINNKQK